MHHQVTELIWENGQLAMHGLATPLPVQNKPVPSSTSLWGNPSGGGGTLESIVDQAKASAASSNGGTSMNTLVPCLASTTDSSPVSRCETCVTELGSAARGSPENNVVPCWTNSRDNRDSECVGRPQKIGRNREKEKKLKGKSSLSAKRSWVHNQSERKRRDKINQKMKALQKLVPNSSKVDKASMLDEVIEYLKQLQAQVQIMGRLNMTPFMMPAAAGQLQLPLMAPMGVGFGLGMGMGVTNVSPVSQPHTTFMPQTTRDTIDPITFTCPSQPMTLDAYSKMAALYRQQSPQFLPPGSSLS